MTQRRLLAALPLLFAAPSAAEEGMWTYDAFPIVAANRTLGTRIDQAWLDRVRLATVKIGGASGGFVSAEGLLLTNEHVAAGCVAALSTEADNLTEKGFAPATRAEEKKCPGYTAEVLTGIRDVTARMQAVGRGLSGEACTRARDAEAARIESEGCPTGDAEQRCEVVSLYRGGRFALYSFHRYADVRLAFAPEHRAAAFGGDLDNFGFPRFAVDAAFLRAYENGKPAITPNHFRWNPAPVAQGAALFLSGAPGATQRLLTQAQLRTIAEVTLPLEQQIVSELRGRLIRFGEESDENAFIATDPMSGIENSYKRRNGRQQALIDPRFMATRAAGEADFRRRAAPLLRGQADPWTTLEALQPPARQLTPAYMLLEARAGGGSQLYDWAEQLVRGSQERDKPNAERLPEFGDARLRSVEQTLFAARPTYPALEQLLLGWWLSKTREILTVDDPRVRGLLGTESPEALAWTLSRSKLGDAALRRRLWEGGLAAVMASDDPLIRFLLRTQSVTREARRTWEAEVQAPTDRASETLAALRFQVYGTAVAPDATGTLRLSYGRAEGWTYDGRTVPYATRFAGLWDRATGAPPFDLAPRLAGTRARIPADTQLDFAASTDTIGGSSGSPVIDATGTLVGANFDSTVLTQRNAYGYDRAVNRSVIVSAAAITAVLRHAYGQERLLAELGVARP